MNDPRVTYTIVIKSTLDKKDLADLIATAGDIIVLKEKGQAPTGAKTAAVYEALQVRPVLSRAQVADQAGASVSRVGEVLNQQKVTHTPDQAKIVASYLSAVADAKVQKVAEKAAATKAQEEAPPAKPAARKKAPAQKKPIATEGGEFVTRA